MSRVDQAKTPPGVVASGKAAVVRGLDDSHGATLGGAAVVPDISLLLARTMPRTYAALIAKGATVSQLAQVLPATAAVLAAQIGGQ
jgi:hypothetical protein